MEATRVVYPSIVCTNQVEAVKPVTARDYPPPPASGYSWPVHLWA